MIPVCPKCDVELFIVQFRDVEVDFCERCRGLWLDAGELEHLMEHTGAASDDPVIQSLGQLGAVPRGRKHLCPRCDEPMLEVSITPPSPAAKPLKLDRCPRGHGVWFDADELKQLLALCRPETGAGKTIDFLNSLFTVTAKT